MAGILKKLFSRNSGNDDSDKPLNLYQYKFIRYKEERERIYPLDGKKVHVPMTKGLVSVILPVYNGGAELELSIESVLAQSYSNFEFIIINDGSTDRTADVLSHYESLDSRIIVIHQENRKLPRTLSRGFRQASGEFYTWTSADNIMPADFLEKMVNELQNDESVDMVFGNMRLIDKRGRWYRRHGWYEYPFGSGNVILPSNTYELNTYANNTIGAAFMYRARCAKIVGDYSRYKHTLEDYDYWMRINSLLKIKHTSFSEPVYYYRWHDNSLTAKDAELGITKNRYKLMALDDFRRDFYLLPLMWWIDYDENSEEFAEEMKAELIKRGQRIIEKGEFKELSLGQNAHDVVYVNIGKLRGGIVLPAGIKKIYISETCESMADNYDIYITREGFYEETRDVRLPMLEEHKGWFSFDDMPSMLSFIDAKVKNDMLYDLEAIIENTGEYSKQLTIVICTNKYGETLRECLKAVCEQTMNNSHYEIIFVDNGYIGSELKELVGEIRSSCKTVDIKYITAPLPGLSTARNAGLWESNGEFVLYLDDDSIAEPNLAEKTIEGFRVNESFGVVGGQVLLEVPQSTEIGSIPVELRPLWSELEIQGDKVRAVKDYGEFPYGANFAARTKSLMQIGGFRSNYGRVGGNFGGGEETLVSFMMKDINMDVALNPMAFVTHRVSAERFNFEHIEKTAYAGIMTQYRLRRDLYAPNDWTDSNLQERLKSAKARLKKLDEGSAEYVYNKAVCDAYDEVLRLRAKDCEFLKTRGNGKY